MTVHRFVFITDMGGVLGAHRSRPLALRGGVRSSSSPAHARRRVRA